MIAENFTAFFADFGVDAAISGRPARGIFDANYVDQLGVEGLGPVFTVRENEPAAHGEHVTVDGLSWRITGIQPESGLKRLILEKA
ncbi:MAG: hypothetical protein LBD67_06390 [Candidatus Accumulibacter sp.]|jgi:hypothetical protein|nr:hypothetical protein [Accumulibacter sp.]